MNLVEMNGPVFTAGIKTLTKNRTGLSIYPTTVVSVGIDNVETWLPASAARELGQKLIKWADQIEDDHAKTS